MSPALTVHRLPRSLILVMALLLMSFMQGTVHLHGEDDSTSCLHCQLDHNPALAVTELVAPSFHYGEALAASVATLVYLGLYPGFYGRAPPAVS